MSGSIVRKPHDTITDLYDPFVNTCSPIALPNAKNSTCEKKTVFKEFISMNISTLYSKLRIMNVVH